MRSDLTSAFLQKKEQTNRTPIQLMVFHFAGGDVYISDKDITINGKEYKGLVENWGEITTAGQGGTDDGISETLQVTVTIWNGGLVPFSNYFVGEDPLDVEVDIYQTFEGLDESDHALISNFVIQDPINISESSRLLDLDLVSLNMRYTANVGKVLTKSNWEKALESDINKGIDLIVGNAGEVQTLFAKSPLQATVKGSFLKLPTIINTHENLDELGFDQSGYIIVNQEIMYYATRDSDTFNVTKRAQLGTIVSEHSDGAQVLEYIDDFTFIIGEGPLSDVIEVRAGGNIVDPSEYVLDLVSDAATITFAKQPTFTSFSRGARTTNIDFDSVGAGNGAFQPHYSYDLDFRTSGALIDKAYNPLSVLQIDPAIDDGEVVRAFLSVEHWATELYSNDTVNVWVEGIGVVGSLSRPNPSDIVDFDAEVDIDHPHGHITGGTHEHDFDNPLLDTDNPSHLHGLDITNEVKLYGSPTSYNNGTCSSYGRTDSYSNYFYFNSAPGRVSSAAYSFNIYVTDISSCPYSVFQGYVTEIQIKEQYYYNGWKTASSQTFYDNIYFGNNVVKTLYNNSGWDYPSAISRRLYVVVFVTIPSGGGNASFQITDVLAEMNVIVDATEYQATNVSTSHTSTGDVNLQNVDTGGIQIKDANDVNDLVTANRKLENIVSQSSSRSVTERFDLTKYLETISWSFFLNREVQLQYTGSIDSAQIIVTYISFELEYRQRSISNTTDITCKPIGSIGNRPDEVIQYLLNTRAGVPVELFGSIWANPELWDDTDIWNDPDIWVDGGEKLTPPAGALFEDAAGRYEFLGYTIDGVIPANWTVKEAVAEINRQSRGRITWSAGKVKLSVREKLDNWTPIKEIGPNETQIKSISITKGKVDEIYNDIDLFYKIDRLSEAQDEGVYDATASLVDINSISKHGQKKDNDKWLFDLVRNDDMAADLVDYYLWRYSEPPTYYEWSSYLQQFELEKGDVVRLTASFTKLADKPLRLLDVKRTFGSGKTNQMNLIKLIGESIKQRALFLNIEDLIIVADDIIIGVPTSQLINDVIFATDIIDVIQSDQPNEVMSITDVIQIIVDYNSSLADIVITSDELITTHSFELEDTVNAYDNILTQDALCFGACGFGGGVACTLPFGSKKIYEDAVSDELSITELISVAAIYNLEFEETVIVSDVFFSSESFTSSVSISEELIFNSCFGCPVDGATGFGLSNFGK